MRKTRWLLLLVLDLVAKVGSAQSSNLGPVPLALCAIARRKQCYSWTRFVVAWAAALATSAGQNHRYNPAEGALCSLYRRYRRFLGGQGGLRPTKARQMAQQPNLSPGQQAPRQVVFPLRSFKQRQLVLTRNACFRGDFWPVRLHHWQCVGMLKWLRTGSLTPCRRRVSSWTRTGMHPLPCNA